MEADFVIKKKSGELIVNCKTKNKVNTRELSAVKSGKYNYLLTPIVVDDGKKITMHYDYEGNISLYEYLQRGISPAIFSKICMNLLDTTEKIKEQVMQQGNLLLDLRYIFIDVYRLDIKYVYVPVVHAGMEVNVADFLRKLPYYCVFDVTEKIEFVSKYIDYFNEIINFSSLDFKKFVKNGIGMNIEAYLYMKDRDEGIEINLDRFIIGQGDDATLRLESKYVSRHHAIIFLESSKYFLKDCDSKNHTYHNGRQLGCEEIVQLSDGDRIRIADVELKFGLERREESEF